MVINLNETLAYSQYARIKTPDLVVPTKVDGEDALLYVSKRPFLNEFLEALSQHYELVIFSNLRKDISDFIIENIDPYSLFRYRLYEDQLSLQGEKKFKDMVKIGRDPKNLILLDNIFY